MIIDVALGILLGALLLALVPVVIVGTVTAFRYLVPIGLALAVAALLYSYPQQFAGTIGLLAIALIALVAWFSLPQRLAQSNLRFARRLQQLHSQFVAALDGKPPFTGPKWLPVRLLAVALAIVVVGGLATGALVVLTVLWR